MSREQSGAIDAAALAGTDAAAPKRLRAWSALCAWLTSRFIRAPPHHGPAPPRAPHRAAPRAPHRVHRQSTRAPRLRPVAGQRGAIVPNVLQIGFRVVDASAACGSKVR